eukprot:1557090-Prymnesium_polylepis.1
MLSDRQPVECTTDRPAAEVRVPRKRLAGRAALDALDTAEAALEEPSLAPSCADPQADWPDD